jgi:hypothetical protein
VVPGDTQIRGDTWTIQINLPTVDGNSNPINWNSSGTVFTVTCAEATATCTPNLSGSPPYVLLSISDTTDAVNVVTWYLSDTVVFGRTFLTQSVTMVDKR